MKTTRLPSLLVTALLAAPVLAQAHPGHDGGHDFVWDLGHFASHPFATAACIAVAAAAGWAVWRLVRNYWAEWNEAARSRIDRR